MSAALALAAAAWSAHSDFGTQRLVSTFLPRPEARPSEPTAAQLLARSLEAENETRRLAEAVRLINADRDRLQARIRTLERNLDEVSDSLAHVRAAALPPSNSTAAPAPVAMVSPALPAPPPVPPPPPPLASVPVPAPEAAWSAAVSRPPAAVLPSPAPWTPAQSTPAATHESATGSIATRTEFAVDLGGGANFQALRTLWTSIRSKHAGLFEGLRPLVSIREGSRSGELELRLVVGPLLNAGDATRLCASLAAAGGACQPALFDGQRLALR